MERMFKRFFSITLFSLAVLVSTADLMAESCSSCNKSCCPGTSNNVLPYLSFRSAGRDNVRKLVGTTSYAVYQYDMDTFYGTFQIIPQYERSFRSKSIAECLFGCDLTAGKTGSCPTDCDDGRVINVSGSQVVDRPANTNDWMAENFYLPRDFQSTLQFSPRIQNIILDFQLYVGLDEWAKGLYFRIYGPVVNARYDLQFCESNITEGERGYQEGFFNNAASTPPSNENAVPVGNLLQSATSFFGGGTPNVDDITTQGLQFAKICSGKQTKTCFGDLRFELGWNFLLEEDYLFGLGVEFAAPTGRRPEACFLFEPQCGNGKHWELGGNVHGLWTMWRSEDEDKHFDFVIEADITHLFNAKQRRTFDLKGKPLSRYMLAQKMRPTNGNIQGNDAAGDGAAGANGTQPNRQFDNEYAPVANFSTRDIKVSASVQADLVAMFDFTVRGFSWDLGYNFWVRSCEKIDFRDDCDDSCDSKSTPFPEDTWALKGDAFVVGFVGETADNFTENDPLNLSATESGATIHVGTNFGAANPNDGAPPNFENNPGIDNTKPATTTGDAHARLLFARIGNADSDNDNESQTRTSIQPITITRDDLNCSGARSRGISHKVFTHFNYTWIDREDWIPYLGVGASAEFGKRDSSLSSKCCSTTSTSSTSSTDCDDCIDCGLSKWAVWLKLGLSFN